MTSSNKENQTEEKNSANNRSSEASSNQVTEQELETCRADLAQIKERFAYLSADFDNFRRNTTKERAIWARTAQASVFKDLLMIIDDFDRAIADLEQATDLQESEVARFKGFDLIHKSFLKLLVTHEVQEIPVDIDFDPEKHEALVQVESDEKETGQIVDVLQKGYAHKGAVLRPAKVSVAK